MGNKGPRCSVYKCQHRASGDIEIPSGSEDMVLVLGIGCDFHRKAIWEHPENWGFWWDGALQRNKPNGNYIRLLSEIQEISELAALEEG